MRKIYCLSNRCSLYCRQLFLSKKYAVGNCTGQIKNKVYFDDSDTTGQWAAQKFIQLDKKQFEFQCFGSACIILYVDPDSDADPDAKPAKDPRFYQFYLNFQYNWNKLIHNVYKFYFCFKNRLLI